MGETQQRATAGRTVEPVAAVAFGTGVASFCPIRLADAGQPIEVAADERRVARAVAGDERSIPMTETLITLAVIFFVIALIAYVMGARGVAGMSAGVGRTLLFVFLVLAVVFLIIGLL